jgi:hypothetical protein
LNRNVCCEGNNEMMTELEVIFAQTMPADVFLHLSLVYLLVCALVAVWLSGPETYRRSLPRTLAITAALLLAGLPSDRAAAQARECALRDVQAITTLEQRGADRGSAADAVMRRKASQHGRRRPFPRRRSRWPIRHRPLGGCDSASLARSPPARGRSRDQALSASNLHIGGPPRARAVEAEMSDLEKSLLQ